MELTSSTKQYRNSIFLILTTSPNTMPMTRQHLQVFNEIVEGQQHMTQTKLALEKMATIRMPSSIAKTQLFLNDTRFQLRIGTCVF